LIALAENRTLSTIESVIKKDKGFILLLEGIEDPFNLGQIFRTAAIAGVDAILMGERQLDTAQSTLMKSSAGLFDAIDLVMSDDLPLCIETLKKNGYVFAVTYRNEHSIDYLNYDFTRNVLLGIGGEMRGLSSAVMNQMDDAVMITYPTDLKVALNAVSASAVLCFEVARQRR
jgi:23S rRNA (guanosine2251-2'-O)-methyltransferase